MSDFFELLLKANTKELKAAEGDYDNLGDAGERAERRVGDASDKMGASIGKMAKGAAISLAVAAASYATFEGAVAATNRAATFDAALAETSTLIDGTAQQMAALEAGAKTLSNQYGTEATLQVQGYYQAISAGASDAAAATLILDSSNKLAVGGVTDVSTGVDALTTAVNAYAQDGLTAAAASDALFVGMRAGKTTIGELAGSLGQIVPIAAAAGVSFDEVVGGISALTTQGLGTAEATTQLRQVIASVIAPTQEAADAASAMGLQFNVGALEAKGLAGFLEDVIARTGGSTEKMASLFGSVEALGAALAFAGGGGDAFADIMANMEEKAGATDDAVRKMDEALSRRLDVSLQLISNQGLAFGQVLLESVVPGLEAAASFTVVLADNSAHLLPVVQGVGIAIATAYAAPVLIGAVTMIRGLAISTAAYSASVVVLSANLGVMATAQLVAASAAGVLTAAVAVLASPIGLAVLGVGAFAGALSLLKDDTDKAALAHDAQSEALGTLAESLMGVNTQSEEGARRARSIAVEHYNAAEAALQSAQAEARLALERQRAANETMNPFDGPGLDELRAVRDNLLEAEAAVAAIRERMAEFGAVANEAGEIIDENTGRVVKTAEEIEQMHAAQLQFMAADRTRSAEALAEANAILAVHRQQNEFAQLALQYGADSVQVADARHEAEKAIVAEQLEGLDVAQSVKDEIFATMDATYQTEAATAAWETRMAGVAAQIGAIGRALSQFGSSAINTAANYAEAEALAAGASVQEAAHARTIEQIKAEADARVAATDNIIEQAAIRVSAAQQVAEAESAAALAAARTDANTRDSEAARVASGGGASGSGGGATTESQQELNQLMQEGVAITQSLWTAQEEYNAAIEQADRLLQVGALSTEAYQQHVGNLSQELATAQFGPAIDGLTSITNGMLDAMIAGDNLLDSFVAMIGQMAIEAAKANLAGIISGLFGGSTAAGGVSSGGGILGMLAGARANGGPVEAGKPYLVNEDTQNSEIYVPSSSGAVLNVPQAQKALMQSAGTAAGQAAAPKVTNNIENKVLIRSFADQADEYFGEPGGQEKITNIIDAR